MIETYARKTYGQEKKLMKNRQFDENENEKRFFSDNRENYCLLLEQYWLTGRSDENALAII